MYKNSRTSHASENLKFREAFFHVIYEANETCTDGIIISEIHLDIAAQLITFDLSNLKKLADFLVKGPWTIELLTKIASQKLATLRFYDDVEVYLVYPIMLRKELEIPISIEEMLHDDHSGVTKKDLEEAKNSVLAKRNDENAKYAYLITHDKWLEALEKNYPAGYQAIRRIEKRGYQKAETDEDTKAVIARKDQQLVSLTERALGNRKTMFPF